MSYNKRFTNWVTRSVLEIQSPHFYARPSQAGAVQKRSGFVFPSTDRVTWLVNRYYYLIVCSPQAVRPTTLSFHLSVNMYVLNVKSYTES